ncbi:MAG: PHP domain-containing protein [Oscillospiraceae bacterium]|nr:PHP domain-containing protein [Oscillospiraceae bacterium]
MIRIETHIHTRESSLCGKITAAEAVERCVELGYAGMVVTDHFSANMKEEWRDHIEHFLCGYRNALAAAPEGFSVLLGMELRFPHENQNDYLVYGLSEAFLCENEDFDTLGIAAFSRFARQNSLLVAQAHPFRRGMTIINSRYLDGAEIYNGHVKHMPHNHNDLAEIWAGQRGLLPLSGSDYHGHGGCIVAPGGVLLAQPVKDSVEFAQILRRREYSILK